MKALVSIFNKENIKYCATLFYIGVKIAAHYWEHSDTSLWPARCSARHRRQYRSEGRRGAGHLGNSVLAWYNRIEAPSLKHLIFRLLSRHWQFYLSLVTSPSWWRTRDPRLGAEPGDAADSNQDFFAVTTFMFPAFLSHITAAIRQHSVHCQNWIGSRKR